MFLQSCTGLASGGIISFLSFCVRISLRTEQQINIEGAERGQGAGHTVISFAGKGGYVGVEGERGPWERDGSHIQLSSLTDSSTLTATFNPVYFQASASEHWGVRSLGGAFAS